MYLCLQAPFATFYRIVRQLGLNQTGHISVYFRQDRTPKFGGRVLPDRTKSRPIFFPIKYPAINLIMIENVATHEFGVKS